MPRIDYDPYNILGLASDASADDIKAAYRRAARRLHPDVNRNPGANAQFQEITAAHDLLTDIDKRRDYDRSRPQIDNEQLVFQFRVVASKPYLPIMSEPQILYMLGDIIPDLRASEADVKRESRLNLTLVLDHSNSMSGTRLDRVKVATHQIIDQLGPEDILSIVGFNDFATIVIPAGTVTDKPALKARVSVMAASGSTEILKGLTAGVEQNRQYLAPRLVNHIILLTDGRTYGDEEACIRLANEVAAEGISISAMGLGQEWNDKFLDDLAAATGGVSQYINSTSAVVKFLNDHVRNLANVFAERVQMIIAPDPDVKLESIFRLAPSPQPLIADQPIIQLGSLQINRTISVLMEFEMPRLEKPGFRSIARLSVTGDVLANKLQRHQAISDMSLDIAQSDGRDDPPKAILDAMEKLSLYRMQERARAAAEAGEVQEATRRYENFASRLFELGESDLAQQARSEAEQVAYTKSLSDKGKKALKYQTRHLLLSTGSEDDA